MTSKQHFDWVYLVFYSVKIYNEWALIMIKIGYAMINYAINKDWRFI